MNWIEAIVDKLWQYWAYLSGGRTLAIMAGLGFACVALLLWLASKTKWGKTKPLAKCIVLSILAHVWLLMYALGNRPVLPQGDPKGRPEGLMMAIEVHDSAVTSEPDLSALGALSPADSRSSAANNDNSPWNRPSVSVDFPRPENSIDSLIQQLPSAPAKLDKIAVSPLPAPETADSILDESVSELATKQLESDGLPQAVPPLNASQNDLVNRPMQAAEIAPSTAASLPLTASPLSAENIQNPYQLRRSSQRLEVTRAYGADEDSEAAVEAALQWLARSQSADGSWNAARFGGGTETRALGEYRYGTGDRADTGVSGLALLAFLSAGHTHREGVHQMIVAKGLSYLLQVQMPSGDLSGPKLIGNDRSAVNARMYCHSMAMLALAEAYAMTQDPVLRDGVLRAAQYSINAQDVRGGGWRYHPGDSGDLSLFGWKAMALHSTQQSGIEIPAVVERRMQNFLTSCTVGNGGLARYRPGEGRPSETMTAEALACRLLLNYPLSTAARQEAVQMVMSHLPGESPDNVYYWYYATLALFQLQDENWHLWNQKLKGHLLANQLRPYQSDAGSWDPDKIWGGYGGRVYSTAMSCLCLEVYYRYLPMYQRARMANR
jgi:hypothetical protein